MKEHNYDNCHNITCRRKCQRDGYIMAIDEFAEAVRQAYASMQSVSEVERATANTIVMGIAERMRGGAT